MAGSDRLATSLGITTLPGSPLSLELLMVANVLPLIAYDFLRRGQLHRTTLVWLTVNAGARHPDPSNVELAVVDSCGAAADGRAELTPTTFVGDGLRDPLDRKSSNAESSEVRR